MSQYIRYYKDQIGGGNAGIKYVFVGSNFQRGRGVGSFLGGLFRRVLPFLASGAKAVGREAVRAGFNVIDDVANNRADFKESLRSRVRESGQNLKRKAVDKLSDIMKGSGYKSRAIKSKRQSGKTRTRVRTALRGKKETVKKRIVTSKNRTKSKTKKRKKRNTGLRPITDIFGPR